MSDVTVLTKSHTIRVGRKPVVLVPLELWRKAEDLLEDQEALASKRYLRRIRRARKEVARGKVLYPFG